MYYVIWTLTGKEEIVRDEILAQVGKDLGWQYVQLSLIHI